MPTYAWRPKLKETTTPMHRQTVAEWKYSTHIPIGVEETIDSTPASSFPTFDKIWEKTAPLLIRAPLSLADCLHLSHINPFCFERPNHKLHWQMATMQTAPQPHSASYCMAYPISEAVIWRRVWDGNSTLIWFPPPPDIHIDSTDTITPTLKIPKWIPKGKGTPIWWTAQSSTWWFSCQTIKEFLFIDRQN